MASPAALTREQERSLWLHRAVLGQLAVDADRTLRIARSNVARWRNAHRADGRTRMWLDRWSALLDQGPDAVAEALVSRSAVAIELRQNTPFAGVIGPATRAKVLTSFTSHWRDAHANGTAA